MAKMRNKVHIALLSGLALVLAACSSSPGNAAKHKANIRQQASEAALRPRIVVTAQHSSGTSVTVRSVTLPERRVAGQSSGYGYVALAVDSVGQPGQLLGATRVKDGTTNDVKLTTLSKLQSGKYFVLLFETGRVPTSVKGALSKSVVQVTVG